jgi:NADH:ubiquinone oxidoreductase subunit 5 (subunit L)/multisubunit Na+/H+ antiporter MnhA subunit
MAIGDVITCLAHSQDIRYLSSGSSSTPISSSFILVSILNLLGLPAIRGFFSKDLVLEIINFRNSSNLILFIVYFNVILTFFYSLQLVFFGGQSPKLAPIRLIHSTLTLHTISLFIVIVISICFGGFYVETLTDSILFIRLNSVIKRIPLFLIGIIVISLTLLTHQIKSNSIIATRFFSRIILLRTVTIPVLSHKSVLLFSYLTKTAETGAFSNQLNITLPRILL